MITNTENSRPNGPLRYVQFPLLTLQSIQSLPLGFTLRTRKGLIQICDNVRPDIVQ